RRPYQVYDAVRRVYGRVLVSLARDAHPYILGREKVLDRDTGLRADIWVTSDLAEPLVDASIGWRLVRTDTGAMVSGHDVTATIGPDTSIAIDRIDWEIPATAKPGTYRVEMELSVPGGPGSANHTDFTLG